MKLDLYRSMKRTIKYLFFGILAIIFIILFLNGTFILLQKFFGLNILTYLEGESCLDSKKHLIQIILTPNERYKIKYIENTYNYTIRNISENNPYFIYLTMDVGYNNIDSSLKHLNNDKLLNGSVFTLSCLKAN